MKFRPLLLLIFLWLDQPSVTNAQTMQTTCKEIQDGIYYYYPKNSNTMFLQLRTQDLLIEKDNETGDSILWKVKWEKECLYKLSFISSNKTFDKKTLQLLKKHSFLYKITGITDSYYTFTGYLDNTLNQPIQTDTMWFEEKLVIPDNSLFQQVPKEQYENALKQCASEKFALLHIYRPGKFANSLGNFIVYFDDNLMCVGKNDVGYVFKIFKEGEFNVHSRLFKDSAGAKINIQFGKTYYVKSFINWTITKRLYNFKLGMAEQDKLTGKDEFDKIKYQ